MNILFKLAIWFLQLLMALIIALGFLIFFFSFIQDDDPWLAQEDNMKSEN